MKFLEIYKVAIMWIGSMGTIASFEYNNWPALFACFLLALTAIIFKDTKVES